MAHVFIDSTGTITGVFANAQGYTTEIADTDPRLVAFNAVVPQSVAMWQARAAIATAGLTDKIQAAVTASGNQAFIAAWEYDTMVSRQSPMIAALGTAIGLTSAQIDALFVSAAALTV